jgi:hypothetical protein
MLSRAVLQVGVRASSIAKVADARAMEVVQKDASMREFSKVNARDGDHVKAMVTGGAENMCHGNIGSPLICPLPASCGQNGLVLAGILGSRSGCDANKEFLFAGPGSFMALLEQPGSATQLTVKNTPLQPPPTPIGDLTLPRIGEGSYCQDDPFLNVTNIIRPGETIFPRQLGAKIVVKCATGTHITSSLCGPPIREVTIRCGYDTKSRGKWILPNKLCRAPGAGGNGGGK